MGKAMEPTVGGDDGLEIPSIGAVAEAFPDLEVLELIGRGGMGAVYKARQKSLDRFVALKLLPQSLAQDPQFPARFETEAKALAVLSHTNIVTIHDFGQAGGFYFLLMEFVDGPNLRDLIRARRLTGDEALAIVPPLCEALQFAHDRGIVHRDIKPENLLLHADGRIKIADFGIAKIVGDGASVDEKPAGTPAYMAPEQSAAPAAVDSRSDIYSLGVVIYEMLTGEQPGDELKPPSAKVAIDVRIDEVVLRALDREPEQRWQTAADLKTQIDTIAAPPASEPRNESDDWRITCLTCGDSKTVAEAGGVRIGARSKGTRILARCGTCDATRLASVHRADAVPAQVVEGKTSVLGFWALFFTLLGGCIMVLSGRLMSPTVLPLALVGLGAILGAVYLLKICGSGASSAAWSAVLTMASILLLLLMMTFWWVLALRSAERHADAESHAASIDQFHADLAIRQAAVDEANRRLADARSQFEPAGRLERDAKAARDNLRSFRLDERPIHDRGSPVSWRILTMLSMGLALPLALIGCVLGWRYLARCRHQLPPRPGVVPAGFAALFWPLLLVFGCTIYATIALLRDFTSTETGVALSFIVAPLVCLGMIRCTIHWVRNEADEDVLPRSPWRVLCAVALIVAGVIVAYSWSGEVNRKQSSGARQYRLAKQEFQRQIGHHEAAKDRAEARLKESGPLTQDNLFEMEEEFERTKATADNALHRVAIQLERLEDSRESPNSMLVAKLVPICVGICIVIAGLILLGRPHHVR